MSAPAITPPPIGLAFLDQNGFVNTGWYRYFQQVSGGAGAASSITALTAQVTAAAAAAAAAKATANQALAASASGTVDIVAETIALAALTQPDPKRSVVDFSAVPALPFASALDHERLRVLSGGVVVKHDVRSINFTGTGATVTNAGKDINVAVASGGGGGGGLTLLKTVVTSGSATTVTIDLTTLTIPSTCTDLVLDAYISSSSGNGSSSDSSLMQFNGDTGSNYNYTSYLGYPTGSTYVGAYPSTGTPAGYGASNAAYSGATVYAYTRNIIPNFKDTSFVKRNLYQNKTPQLNINTFYVTGGGEWLNTAAINKITIFQTANNWVDGTTFKLYCQ